MVGSLVQCLYVCRHKGEGERGECTDSNARDGKEGWNDGGRENEMCGVPTEWCLCVALG